MSERTVYRVWHADDYMGESAIEYIARAMAAREERSCHVPDLADMPCDQVYIQTVEINDETGEEVDVT